MPGEIGFDPQVVAALDAKTATGMTSLDLPEGTRRDFGISMQDKKNGVKVAEYSPKLDSTGVSTEKSNDEQLREQRRALTEKIGALQANLGKATETNQSAGIEIRLAGLQEQLRHVEADISTAESSLREQSRVMEEKVAKEAEKTGQEGIIAIAKQQIESIRIQRKDHEKKLAEAKKKLFPHTKLAGWLRKQVGWSDTGVDVAERNVEEDEIKRIIAGGGAETLDEARAQYAVGLANITKEAESAYAKQITDASSQLTRIESELGLIGEKVNEAARALAAASNNLDRLKTERESLNVQIGTKGAEKTSANTQQEQDIIAAQDKVKAAEAELTNAEAEEKAYWEKLKNDLLADFGQGEQEIASEKASKEKAQKREGVRNLFAAPERDFLNLVHEIGRDTDGSVSVDLAVGDLAQITVNLLDRYRALESAVGQYGADNEVVLAHSMAIVENERFDLENAQRATEYAKFNVLTDEELEEKAKSLEQRLLGDPKIQRLRDELTGAEAWLKLPAHKTEGFKKTHKGQINEKKALIASHKKDLKAAEKDVEMLKARLVSENERQKVKAEAKLIEYKKTYLSEYVKRRKAEELRAADEFLGALSEFTPEERQLAVSGELNKAILEAEAVFMNLIKWRSLLENPQGVAHSIAETEVTQDRLVKEAEDVVGRIGAEIGIERGNLKLKRGKNREELQGKIDQLEKTLTEAQRKLARAHGEKSASIEKARQAYLPAELAADTIEESQGLQFGTKRAVTDVRRLYTAVMYGGEAHRYDDGVPGAQVTERVGMHEQWIGANYESFEDAIAREVAQAKEAPVAPESAEVGGNSIEDALARGSREILKAVLANPEALTNYLVSAGAAEVFVKKGGLQALIEGVAGGAPKSEMIQILEAQNMVYRAVPNSEALYSTMIAANEAIINVLMG